MFDILQKIEGDILPGLLQDSSIWSTLLIDYEFPVVERLWLQHEGFRIYLHRISPCKGRALLHPHPWPSAVKIIRGAYTMEVGSGPTDERRTAPDAAAKIHLQAESGYEMVDPNGWHSVSPDSYPSYSLMVTGSPYGGNRYKPGKSLNFKPLTADVRDEILGVFQKHYLGQILPV